MEDAGTCGKESVVGESERLLDGTRNCGDMGTYGRAMEL